MRLSEESDPFLDIDESEEGDDTKVCNQELGELIAKLQDRDNTCEVSDLVPHKDVHSTSVTSGEPRQAEIDTNPHLQRISLEHQTLHLQE